jgi:pSer/pThr/pTyr-binding forkhead associated (FHA) protein
VPPFVLTVLKIVFLAFLYFFVYRALHSVVVDLRGVAARPAGGGGRGTATAKIRSGSRAPRSVQVVDETGKRGRTVPLDGPIQIGRADACQISLTDTYASSFHARIFERDGAWYVEDLGSTNGTYLNQRRVTAPAELRAGDRIRIGKTSLELRR